MARMSDPPVRLTGGTFFDILTRAMKAPTRKRFGIDAEGVTEVGLMRGLVRVFGVENPVFPDNFGPKVTEYKQCKKSSNNRMPFEDEALINKFDINVKGNYQKPLNVMAEAVSYFIDVEDKGDRLVRSLLEMLKRDKSIDPTAELYIKPDGTPVKAGKIEEESVFYIESVLLGIWHYIITIVKDNKEGIPTYNSWYFKKEGSNDKPVYVGTIGENTERPIKVLRVDCTKLPKAVDEPKDAEKDLENYNEYLQEMIRRYDSIKTLLYKDVKFPFYKLYVCNGIYANVVEQVGDDIRISFVTKDSIDSTFFDGPFKHVVLTGMGGLGKSMMLRHLLLDAAKHFVPGKRIPIFVQLQEYDENKKEIAEFVFESLNSHGVQIDREVFNDDLAKGKYLILMDGMDEIGSSRRGIFETRLRKFAESNSRDAIVVSSRPYSEFVNLPFSPVRLLPFDINKAEAMIDKLEFEPVDVKEKFVAELKSGLFKSHKNFTENPLLLTLMLMTYREHLEITGQDQMHYFYGEAYDVLASRHDAYKESSVRRPLSTGLSKERFAEYFAEFCAHSYTDEKRTFKKEELVEYFDNLKILKNDLEKGEMLSSSEFIDDVTTNLCIMFYADGEYHFIHNSFQEYFCAKYFATKIDDKDYKTVGDFFEGGRKKCRSFAADHTFDMWYEMRKDKVERFVFIPFLEKLIADCESHEGFRSFLKMTYPIIRYCVGDTAGYYVLGPRSFLTGFILRANGQTVAFEDLHLPYHDDFVIARFAYAEDPETGCIEPMPIEVLEKDEEYIKVNGAPQVVGMDVEVETDKLYANEKKYKDIVDAVEDKNFWFYRQYEELKNILSALKARHAEDKTKSGMAALFK